WEAVPGPITPDIRAQPNILEESDLYPLTKNIGAPPPGPAVQSVPGRQRNPCRAGSAIRARPATVSVVRLGAPLARLVCAHSNTAPGQPRSAAAVREPSKGRTMTLHMPAETAAQDRVWMAFPSSGYALGDTESQAEAARATWAAV